MQMRDDTLKVFRKRKRETLKKINWMTAIQNHNTHTTSQHVCDMVTRYNILFIKTAGRLTTWFKNTQKHIS